MPYFEAFGKLSIEALNSFGIVSRRFGGEFEVFKESYTLVRKVFCLAPIFLGVTFIEPCSLMCLSC